MFRFASVWYLCLLALPWGWLLYRAWIARRSGADADGRPGPLGDPHIRVSSLAGLGSAPVSWGLWVAKGLPLFKVIALSMMILALARPQAGDRKIRVNTQGINIILALDLSNSMSALDFKRDGKIVTRLDAVKGVVGEFIMEREGDRIGLVVFGSHAFTQLPLTRDYNTIAFMLDHLKIGAAGPKTAIGDALGIALKRLEDVDAKSNIIILLTDGKSNSGDLDWEDGAKIAAGRGVKIYTVGVGSKGKAPFLVDGLFGKQYVYQHVDMDWEALDAIAKATGGQFFKAKDTESLAKIYKLIDTLETTEVEVDKWVEYKELFPVFLGGGMVLYLICLVLGNTRFIRIP